MLKVKAADVGVIVGRFQVDDLHEGHKVLIDSVVEAHGRVIIFVGLSPCKCTVNNPLDFESRRSMIYSHYPDITVLYIKDIHSDQLWSEDLDSKIESMIGPEQSVCLYGSRDSFLPYYYGQLPCKELQQKSFVSGTERRKKLAIQSYNSKAWRAGAIWAASNQWPGPMVTIDVGIFNDRCTLILLGRKKKEDKFRLVGGFVQNKESFEETVVREAKEETHLNLCGLEYKGSFFTDDWRYKAERDKITTVLFSAKISSGKPEPDDDIWELQWFDFDNELTGKVVENHVKLVQRLLQTVKVITCTCHERDGSYLCEWCQRQELEEEAEL